MKPEKTVQKIIWLSSLHDELTANFSYGKMHGNPTKLPFQYNPLPTFTIKINLNLCLSVVLLSAIPADPGGGLTYKKHDVGSYTIRGMKSTFIVLGESTFPSRLVHGSRAS